MGGEAQILTYRWNAGRATGIPHAARPIRPIIPVFHHSTHGLQIAGSGGPNCAKQSQFAGAKTSANCCP